MPELPEVENVVRQLIKELPAGSQLLTIQKGPQALRFDRLNLTPLNNLIGQTLQQITRRAKYILLEMDDVMLISHLGMTGVWYFDGEAAQPPHATQHTHLTTQWETPLGSRSLNYCDPRRFGAFIAVPKDEFADLSLIAHLGLEPFDDQFDGRYLSLQSKKSTRPVKSYIMDQAVVVGVGNIYASEALFFAKVHPLRPAQSLSAAEWDSIAFEIRHVLGRAIDAGGSTLQDYRQTNGASGQFQNSFAVYGRDFEPCYGCGEPIHLVTLSGRSTYYCKVCQR